MLLRYILKLPSISNVAGGTKLPLQGIIRRLGTSGGVQLQVKTLFVKHQHKSVSLEPMSVDFCSDDYVDRLPTLRRLFRVCAASYLPCPTREHGALAEHFPTYREHAWEA